MQSHDNHAAKLMSIPIAMMMAVVATLGAVVAYRAALAEHETLRSERRLQQGKMLEFVYRQDSLNKISNETRYEYDRYVYRVEADHNLKEADQLSASAPGRAALLTLEAQEDHAAARVMRAYRDFFWVDLPRSREDSLQLNAAKQLSEFGFDTLWAKPARNNDPVPPIWKRAESYVENERGKVVRLAGAVLLFVLALAFFTFAQLSLKNVTRKNLFACAGILIALIGLSLAVRADRDSWKTLTLSLTVFVSIVLFGLVPAGRKLWLRMRFVPPEETEPIHPSELDPLLFAGMRMHMAPVAHGFGRFIILMIAVTAVLSASSGLLYSRATTRSAAAFSEAIENQGTLFKTNSSNDASLFNTLSDMSNEQQYRIHYEAARQRVGLAKENPSLLDLKAALAQEDHWKLLLSMLSEHNKSLEHTFRSEVGPDQDRNFPGKLVSQGRKESEKAFALSDANNEISLRWQEKATTYLAMLTFFAIALYLFGQALSMGRTRDAVLLVVFSCSLVVYSFGYGAFMSWESRAPGNHVARPECRSGEMPGEDAAEDAARHYAEGKTWFDGFSGDPQELAKAAQEFGCAVDVRPGFAMADFYYALSTQLAETPQLKEGSFVSIISKKSLPIVADHERHALNLIEQQGLKAPAIAQVGYGFNSVLEGLLQNDRRIVERGIKETRKGIDLDPTNLAPQFNLGLGLLADGKKQDGIDIYEQAIKHVRGRGDLVAGAITDLDILRRYCGGADRKDAYCEEIERQIVPRLKSEMVTAAWPPRASSQATAPQKIADIQLITTASGFGWRAPTPNLDKNHDVLSVLWYAYNPEWETWRVLPVLSGRANLKPDDQGMASAFRSVLTTQGRTCVSEGTYRAEFYIDGVLAGTQEISTQRETFVPVVFPALNQAMCYPESWQSWESSDPQDSSFVKGYTGEGGSRGVFLFTYFNPRQRADDVSQDHYLNEAVTFLASHSLTPHLTKPKSIDNCAGQPVGANEKLTVFTGGSASAVARIGMEQDGLVHAAVAFDNTGNRWNCDTLMSVTRVLSNID